MFEGQYTPSELEYIQRQFDKLSVRSYSGKKPDFEVDPIEEVVFPTVSNARGQARSWVLDNLGLDKFIEDNWDKLVNSPIRLVFVIHDTAGTFNSVTGMDKYEIKEWSADNTGTGQKDDHDHGHMVASCIVGDKDGNDLGVLRKLAAIGKVKIVADKDMSKGSGSFGWITKGTKRTIDLPFEKNDMVFHVYSLGALGPKEYKPLDDEFERGIAKGQVFGASSGNSGNDPNGVSRVGYPAVNPNIQAHGATQPNDTIQRYSSTGEEVFAVSGSGVPVITKEGRIQTAHGTSFSHPIKMAVLGLISLYLGKKITQEDADNIVRSMTQDLGTKGRDVIFGYGITKGHLIKDGDFGDHPEDPDPPQEPEVKPYTLKVKIQDFFEKYKNGKEADLEELHYDNMVVEVVANKTADVMQEKVEKMIRDYMSRHYLYFPDGTSQPYLPAVAARMTDMFFEREYGLVIDVKSVQVSTSKTSSYLLEGDELMDWKNAPEDVIGKAEIEMMEIVVS